MLLKRGILSKGLVAQITVILSKSESGRNIPLKGPVLVMSSLMLFESLFAIEQLITAFNTTVKEHS